MNYTVCDTQTVAGYIRKGVDMQLKPEEFFSKLRKDVMSAIGASVEDSADDVKTIMRQEIPANRSKTRRSLRVHPKATRQGFRLSVKLQFRERYRRSRDTTTARILRTVFNHNRLRFVDAIKNRLKFKN